MCANATFLALVDQTDDALTGTELATSISAPGADAWLKLALAGDPSTPPLSCSWRLGAGSCRRLDLRILAAAPGECILFAATPAAEAASAQGAPARPHEAPGEDRFRAIAEAAADWFWESDASLRFTDISERFFEVTGFSRAEILGKTRAELVPIPELEREPEKWRQHLDDLRAHRAFRDFEYRLTAPDGRRVTIHISGKPRFDASGNFQGYLGCGSDVTAHRATEETQRQILLELDAIFTHASVGIIYSRERVIQRCNPRAAEILGYAQSELIGSPGLAIYPNLEAYEALGRAAGPLLAAGDAFSTECQFRRKDGNLVWCRTFAKAFDPEETQRGTIWIIEDIEQTRQAQAALAASLRELEAIMNNASVGILFTRDSTVRRYNPKFAEMFRVDGEQLIGQPARVLFETVEAYEALGRAAFPLLSVGQPFHSEMIAQRRHGGSFYAEIIGYLIDPANPPYGTIWILNDITERRRAQEQLNSALRELEAIMNNASVGILLTRDRKIQRYNHKFGEMFGFAGDAAIALPARMLYRSDDEYAAVGRTAGPLLSTAKPFQTELYMRRQDGSDLWINLIGYVSNPAEPTQGTIWILEDRTELKRADEALHRSHLELEQRVAERTAELSQQLHFLQQLIEAIPGPVFYKDAETRYLGCNSAFEAYVGIEAANLIGKTAHDIAPKELADQYLAADRELLARTGSQIYESTVRYASGELRDVIFHKATFTRPDGKVGGIVGVILDITERKRTEELLRLTRISVDTASDALLWITPDARIVDVNVAACRTLGYTREQLLQLRVADIDIYYDDAKWRTHFDQLRHRGSLTFETIQRTRDGRLIPVEVVANHVQVGNEERNCAFVRDISERKKVEEALDENRQKYRALSEAAFEAIFISENGRCLEQNQRAEQMFGYSGAEAVGRLGTEWIVAEDRERVMQNMLSGSELPYEVTGLRKDGTTFPALIRGKVMYYKGRTVRVTSVSDITERRLAEAALRESEERLRAITDNAAAVIFMKDLAGRYLHVNRRFETLFHVTHADILGKSDHDVFPHDLADAFVRNDKIVIESGQSLEVEELVPQDGGLRTYMSVKFPLRSSAGDIYAVCGVATDITDRKLAEQNLRVAATTFESQEGMIITDADEVILRVNRAFTEITGYAADEAVGKTPRLLGSGHHDKAFFAEMWACIRRDGAWHGELWSRRKNGEIYPQSQTITAVKGDDGIVTHYVGTFADITQRKLAENEIKDLAFYDPLTRLPNRRLLLDRLRHTLSSIERNQRAGALMFIDLDNFKTLNDTRGHDIGDQLLIEVAQRIQSKVRQGDTVARLGGDEFVVMLENLDPGGMAAAQAESVAVKILMEIGRPYLLRPDQDAIAVADYNCTASMGITLYSASQESVDDLLKQADLAMYQAKAAGRNTLRFFDPGMQARAIARAALEVDLRRGLQQGQFVLHYQAQVNQAGQVTGAEALVRWNHPQRGVVMPAEFIPLAEDNGLILTLGQWVLETACQQLVTWSRDPARSHLTVAVNVSVRQFRHHEFVGQVLATLDACGARPELLKLELTESLLMDDVDDIIARMEALKARGVGFALDDFGTGYSSLSYLKKLPLNQLKIDQSFVRDLLSDPNDAAISRTIIALGQSLGLEVIAEGVETWAHRDFLATLGCHAYQGYFFSAPLAIEDFEAFAGQLCGGD